ncbi:bifunctional diguanylate cyclase/phosphodiesterase [Marinomonas algicola]|uniref:bifunctional diguanylate cyclase/phosphodiesterase n=1 Tax=Marinomonas algicola TaxID=2773454 RepID=UPI00174AF178|nr:bifunctional diguanylate cyclase/phosphodiesterase [Marinomonas algicola]
MSETLNSILNKHLLDKGLGDRTAFIEELRAYIDDLEKQNGFLKNSLELTTTELVQRYERLELSNHLFEATFNAARDAMLVTEIGSDTFIFNDEFKNVWCLPEEWAGEIDQVSCVEHILALVLDPDGFTSKVLEDASSSENRSGVLELKDGRLLEYECRIRYFQGENIGRLYCINDITQLVKSQKVLEQSQHDLLQAHKLSQMGAWSLDLTTNTITLSKGLLTLFGLPSDDSHWSIERYLSCIPENEREKVDKSISNSLSYKSVFQVEHRFITPRGKEHYVSVQGGFEKKTQHMPPRLLGLLKDITKDKDSINRIKLSSQFFHSSFQGNILMDRNHNVLDFNTAAAEILDLEERAFSENVNSRLSSVFTHELSNNEIWMRVYSDQKWSGEVNFQDERLLGKTLWLSLEAYFDDEGVLTNYLVIFSDISESKKAQVQLKQLAYYDAQTLLPNRTRFEQYLISKLDRAQTLPAPIVLIYLDLDRFKYVNDSLGHDVGDELLVNVARRLKDETQNQSMVARQGGDEFVIVLEGDVSRPVIEKKAQGIIDALSLPFNLQGHQVFVGASMGIVNLPEHASDCVTAMKYADIALYKAKNAGKGCYRFWHNEFLKEATPDRMLIESLLREGIKKDQLVLFYQPIVDASTGNIRSLEALVRWNHPEKGMIPPDDFIPIAEETNLIQYLDDWVIHEVARQQKEWKRKGLRLCPVSINISASHISLPSLLRTFEALMQEQPYLVNLLQVEVTETAMMMDPDNATLVLNQLFRMGVTSSIDDFGSGYTSLGYLKKLNADVLKIDRSFIDGITTDNFDHDVAKAIIALAVSMSMKVVAEGVENQAQWSMLKEFGCDYLQGYYFYRPMVSDKVYELLKRNQDKEV